MKRHTSMLLFSLFMTYAESLSAAADSPVPNLAPGVYTAVTESEWSLELKLERDGGANYTFSNWEPGKGTAKTTSNTVRGRWSRDGNVVTVRFSGADTGNVVVYEIIECLSYRLFGLKGCSFGLKPVTNTMPSGYSQPVWNSTTFKVPSAT